MMLKEKGADAAKGLSEEIVYKIDIPANRYDLLCVEGIARALRLLVFFCSLHFSQLFLSGLLSPAVHSCKQFRVLQPNTSY